MTFSVLYATVLILLQLTGCLLNRELFNFFWDEGIRSAFTMMVIEFAFWVVAAIPLSLLVWCVL